MKRYEVTGEQGVEVKRFYIPLVITAKCTRCGEECTHDFDDNYLSYPTINKQETETVFCKKCDEYFEMKITLRITVEVEE